MRETVYYTGLGPTKAAQIAWHVKYFNRHYDRMIAGMKEERALGMRAGVGKVSLIAPRAIAGVGIGIFFLTLRKVA